MPTQEHHTKNSDQELTHTVIAKPCQQRRVIVYCPTCQPGSRSEGTRREISGELPQNIEISHSPLSARALSNASLPTKRSTKHLIPGENQHKRQRSEETLS
ncbi:hypothetical protein VTH06DRAFT_554 [Thermothelomyces fergusii]